MAHSDAAGLAPATPDAHRAPNRHPIPGRSLVARALPAAALQYLRFARARRAWRSPGVVFVHIPKNAGVSISRALYGRPLGHFSAREIQCRDPLLLDRTYSFAVLRDPLERAISAYRFATAGATEEMAVANPERYRSPEFADFDRFVCTWLVNQDLDDADGIFQSQASYVEVDGRVAVAGLFNLADLTPLLKMLRQRVDPGLMLEHRNVTAKQAHIAASEESRAAIAHLYRRDYELIREVSA
ncbi:MAG: sulfotransferase family 2 domain-containing protein [Actinobacteria bacterium]|nr:sulfotransferase family 2 domain-containing protein [Actinomycetota bacterium]